MAANRELSNGEPTTQQMTRALSLPVDPALLRGPDLNRRRFLQAAGIAGVATLLPAWLAEAAAAATPLRADEGVLVLVTLAGGNDGLNTFIPVNEGAYRDARHALAISPSAALPLTGQRSLHPNLGYLKSVWDRGDLAVIEGVGHDDATLSHFVSMAQTMAANGNGQPGSNGWLGRVLDGLSGDPLNGVAIGSTVPLVVQGQRHRASAVPRRANDLRQLDTADPVASLQYRAMQSLAGRPSGLGSLGDVTNANLGKAIDLADQLRPLVPEESNEAEVVTEMRLAARLINANLGIRVISIMFGDFDTHANQAWMHSQRMTELDAALRAFHETLSPSFAGRTLVVGTSEFGRRLQANNNGTDHGTANALFAIGAGVNGGFFGQAPSLTDLDQHRNLRPQVDYRQVYGNLIGTWLGADQAEILGRDWGDLGFLRAPATGGGSPPPGGPTSTPIADQRAEVARLYLAYFLRRPDDEGFEYWVGVRRSGRSLAQISTDFATSGEFVTRYGALSNRQFVDLVYRNVLLRAPDGGGLNHWASALDRGVPRGTVMLGFSESIEFRNRTADEVASIEAVGPVGRLYRAYFLRAPDETGLAYWTNTGLPLAAVSEQFAASTEFRNRYGALDDRGFITTAYRNVLGRNPDASGLNHWLGILGRGTSRGSVMLGFSNSPEFIRRVRA